MNSLSKLPQWGRIFTLLCFSETFWGWIEGYCHIFKTFRCCEVYRCTGEEGTHRWTHCVLGPLLNAPHTHPACIIEFICSMTTGLGIYSNSCNKCSSHIWVSAPAFLSKLLVITRVITLGLDSVRCILFWFCSCCAVFQISQFCGKLLFYWGINLAFSSPWSVPLLFCLSPLLRLVLSHLLLFQCCVLLFHISAGV